ncbi:MAG: lysine--tRNA ligase [bacterium]
MSTAQNLREERLKKLEKIRKLGWNPYPSSYEKKQMIGETREMEGKEVKTAGKLFSFRTHGNIAFADLKDESGKIQLFFKKDVIGVEAYKQLSLLDIGDYIGVEGTVAKTTAGEISIIPASYTLLCKSLQQLPHEWFGIKDTEQRFRQRYLDLLLNPQVRERFNTRTKILRHMREYLDDLGFWEVETPIFHPLYGGANAKPFTTHYNALGQDMYLRIAFELYLKRLISGGYERVYEIGRDFRNEGYDRSHSPEFTMVEWYEAYADYHRVMDVTEGLFKHLAQKLNGTPKMKIDEKEIDLSGKWPRISMTDIMKKELGIDVEISTQDALLAYAQKNKIELVGGETKGQIIFAIFEHAIPDKLIGPIWIIDYPEDVSPLSKNHSSKPGWVERFEGYIGGKEICDGWSELTDPLIQRQRFENDQKASRKDKSEAQQMDEDFIMAMEFGMPPMGGIGIGVERLTMFFTNTWAIREVMLFPTLKKMGVQTHDAASSQQPVKKSDPLYFTREKALFLIQTKLAPNVLKHSLAVEAVMKALAKHFHEDEVLWGITGLLHDADWEETKLTPELHAIKTVELLKKEGETNAQLLDAILAHNFDYNKQKEPGSPLDWSLSTCDSLTGLITATALILPNKKLAEVTPGAVLKKFKNKGFAARTNREMIQKCEDKLGIPLADYVSIALQAMKGIADALGL